MCVTLMQYTKDNTGMYSFKKKKKKKKKTYINCPIKSLFV